MGNQQSTAGSKSSNQKDNTENKLTLSQTLDYIASNYILTQNFQDLKNLSDQNYCDKLVVLTSKVISNKLKDQDIKFLAQRTKDGTIINEMTKDQIVFMKKNDLPQLDVTNSTQKRRICIGIAKFYVKLAHLFAAIITTINPTYTYKDAYGQTVQISALQKTSLPSNSNAKLSRNNLCSKRLNALLGGHDNLDNPNSDTMTIKPNFCDININPKTGQSKALTQETGLPELKSLYFDVYDYDQGGFKSMSDTMKVKYQEDVKNFYREFTGKTTVPSEIKNFSDIKLRDYKISQGCKNGIYRKGYTGSKKQKLFALYAEHIKEAMERAEASQEKLLDIIDECFVFSYDTISQKKVVTINPELTEDKLQELVNQTRQIIITLYTNCENDFISGLEIFQAIVEKQVLDSTQAQLSGLEKELEITTTNDKPPATSSSNINRLLRSSSSSPSNINRQPRSSNPAIRNRQLYENPNARAPKGPVLDVNSILNDIEKEL